MTTSGALDWCGVLWTGYVPSSKRPFHEFRNGVNTDVESMEALNEVYLVGVFMAPSCRITAKLDSDDGRPE